MASRYFAKARIIAPRVAALWALAGCVELQNNGVPYDGVAGDEIAGEGDSELLPDSLPVMGDILVTRILLLNAETDALIQELHDGDVISFSALGTREVAIVAETSPERVGSVLLYVNGAQKRIEDIAPYSLAGDSRGDLRSWDFRVGTYQLGAVPFADLRGAGAQGLGRTVTIEFTE